MKLLALMVFAAIMVLSGCVRVTPFEEDMNKASRFFKEEKYTEAARAYTEILDKGYELESPAHEASIYVNRGNVYQIMNRYEDALRDYNTAIKIAPDIGEPYANRGVLYDNMEQYEKAVADYRKALELNEELGEPPGIFRRILYNPSNINTIRDRLEFLERFMKAHEEGMAEVLTGGEPSAGRGDGQGDTDGKKEQ